jgi:ectoine hydroxylase-related dioxygenase (phytanoyl-CoA dioxygenase family)
METQWQAREPQVVLASAGDALVFRSDVWHAGSDNRTASDVRYLLQVHYGRREMAQHFSPYMSWRFNPAVLAAASPRQRRLLGDHDPGAYD